MSNHPAMLPGKSPVSLFWRLWFAWLAAALLALALPAQAAVTTGVITFGTSHTSLSVIGTHNGIAFDGAAAGDGQGWVYSDSAASTSCGNCGGQGDFALPQNGGNSAPSTAYFRAETLGDTFNVSGVRIYNYGNNTTITVTGYLNGNPVKTVPLTVTPVSPELVTFYLGFAGVDSVEFVSSDDWFFAIDDLGIAPVPAVTSISPASGPPSGGTSVTITGTGLSGANAPTETVVTFGATAATATVDSDTQITAIAPPGTGTVDVRVTTVGGTSATSAADQFTYLAPPTVTAISPTGGPTTGGTTVVVTGTGFTGATAVVFGGTAAASYTVDSPTQITASAPAGTGTVDVRVTTPGGTSATSAADQFTYIAGPTVTSISPTNGSTSGGTTVTITGTGFTGATAVSFGASPAVSFTVNSATQITATAPAGTGTVDVTVTTPSGTSATSAADQFTYVPPPVANAVSATVAYASSANPITLNITGTATSVAIASAASHGTATASGVSITYTPTAGYGGPDSFTYTASNVSGTSAPATVTITVSPPTIAYAPGSPPNGTVGVAYSQSLAGASGGTGPYTYSVTSGSLPAGLILAADGTLSGTPMAVASASFSVRATDSSSSTPPATGPYSSADQPLTLNIVAPTITLSPATLPNPTVGVAYSQTVTGSGGASPYTFAITAGALPPGLVLGAGGAITGTPTAAGLFNFTVTATDNGSFTGSQAYSVTVGAPTITLAPATLPTPVVGVAYSQALTATGGTAPYTYSLTAGALPAGLTLSGGTLSGTPTAAGSFSFTVQATDSSTGTGAPFSGSRAYSVTIVAPTITLAPGTLPNPAVGTAYNQTVTASGGASPYTYAVTAGALPAGLALNSGSGVLSGTPSATGAASFTITATDANGFTGAQAYSVTVAPSANADLSALVLSSGSLVPAFSAGTTGYTASVANAVTSVTVTPTVAASGATVTVNGTPVVSGSASGPVMLNVGSNSLTVVVTAPNGTTTKTYTVAVTRAPLQSVVDGASGMTVSIANSSPTCTFTSTAFAPTSSAGTPPPTGFSYPYNMAAFTAAQCDAGSVLTVTLTFPHPVPAGSVLMKYNAAATPPWQPFTPAISGNQVVYTIQDGGLRDDDGAVNGQFVDPVVLAVPLAAAAIPTLNEWGLLLLSVFGALLGWWQLRQRPQR